MLRVFHHLKCIVPIHSSRSYFSSENVDLSRLRNIGIMAHIDAGKTTTTERMLYHSGYINRMGEVHRGDTTMDYLDEERERGITITAASITFPWNKHQINLIDTPGHVDFTMEVERSLRVMDGAILILDGSAGVEAQTLTVWRQATKCQVPRIGYINKMDKASANVDMTVNSVHSRLGVEPLLCQHPMKINNQFSGVVDLPSMQGIIWEQGSDKFDYGKTFKILNEETLKVDMKDVWSRCLAARERLVEQACDFDNQLAEQVLSLESFSDVGTKDLVAALRRITVDTRNKSLVCFLGSSYKNVGVQPLLNAVIDLLPSPADREYDFVRHYGGGLCGLAFKIIHHPQKGVLTFVRLYSGSITTNGSVYNATQGVTEKHGKVYVAFADDFVEVDEVRPGDIAVVAGFQTTVTGDTLVGSASTFKAINKRSLNSEAASDATPAALLLPAPAVPEPVYYCSIEPPSAAFQKQFDRALDSITREDPSIRVRQDKESGQVVIGGMGELHLQVVSDRIRTQWKVDVELGKLQIAYREVPTQASSISTDFTRSLGDKKHSISLGLELSPVVGQVGTSLAWSKSRTAVECFSALRPQQIKLIERGLLQGLEVGPSLGFPVSGCLVKITSAQIMRGTSEPMVISGCSSIVKSLIENSSVRLAEPFMSLEIVCEEEYSSVVTQDLIRRRGKLNENSFHMMTDDTSTGGFVVISAQVPLSELEGYVTHLRTVTSGKATMSMEPSHYELMDADEENNVKEMF